MGESAPTSRRRVTRGVVRGIAVVVVFAVAVGAGVIAASERSTDVPEVSAAGTGAAAPVDDGHLDHEGRHDLDEAADPDDSATTPADHAVGHEHGQRDVDADWDRATAAERAGATALLETTRAAVVRYADVDVALADGFRPNVGTRTTGLVHYPNHANRRDDSVLDPNRLEGLVYHHAPDGRVVLAGALFTESRGALPPTPGGDITMWHSHVPGCAHPAESPGCEGRVPLYMLHVWLLDGVDDPFADSLRAAMGARPRLGA